MEIFFSENHYDFVTHKMAQIVCNNYSGYVSHIDNKQLTTLLTLCDAMDVVQPVLEAFENFMLLQQPIRKQNEIQALKHKITKVRKARPRTRSEGADVTEFVEKRRELLKLLENELQKVQDECFLRENLVHPRCRHGFGNVGVQVNWQHKIKKFVRESFGIHAKARTAFIVELVLRGKQN